MIGAYVVSLGFFICFNIIAGIAAYRDGRKVARSVAKLLVAAIVPMLANILLVLTDDEILARMGFVLFFIGTDWMLLAIYRFIMDYCNYPYEGSRNRTIWIVIMGIDTLSVFLNPFFHHVFDVTPDYMADGHLIYKLVSLWYHKVHLAINALVMVIALLYLIRKITETSRVYLEKYFFILVVMLVTGAWEFYTIFAKFHVDLSILGYGVGSVLIYFISLQYQMYLLTDRMLTNVVENMGDCLFCFDSDGKCIYYNESGREMFQLPNMRSMELAEAKMREMFDPDILYSKDRGKNITHLFSDDRVVSVEFSSVYDERMTYTGYYVIVEDVTKENQRLADETYKATHDSLTGIYNREELYRLTEKLIREHPEERYTVVVSDIKEFKMINDIFGSEVGDEILVKLADKVKAGLKEGDVFGRIGADKYGLILKSKDFNPEQFTEGTRTVAYVKDQDSYPLVVHMGVYEVRNSKLSAASMYDRAFMALSTVKNELQQRIAFYDDSLREGILWEQKIVATLDDALKNGDIVPYLQAQVDTEGRTTGCEALVRWNHATEGFLTPGRFMPFLEKNGMVVKIDMYIWEYACKILKRWKEEGRDDMYISVNISQKDFYFVDVYDVIYGLVQKYDVNPSRLRLEITESTFMKDMDRKIEVINQLREKGFLLEMDDFGSGYSSLNMLKDMPVDVLKVDMLFLSKTENEDRTRAILELIIGLAKRLEIPVISEGVEEAEQVAFLTEMGCDMFQGYYFAKPIALLEFEERFMQTGAAV